METFLLSVTVIALFFAVRSYLIVRKTKNQISEMLEALADIRNGNGNRRILAKPEEPAAPLAYEINEIVLSYENRLSALRRAEEANRQLMTSLSHDVRTPLTTLIGYLDAACKGIVTGPERDAYIRTARRKSHGLKDYIDVLFDWFKLNSDDFAMKPETLETAELTRNILADWVPIFEEKNLEYAVSVPEQPVFAYFDADGYMRIFHNLLQNVIVHSHADRIEIALQKCENGIELTVSDNGVGMEAEDLEHIFERLYKCDKARSEKGSGLGLSIACQLAAKMNGKLTAQSAPGRGSRFTLRLPLCHP